MIGELASHSPSRGFPEDGIQNSARNTHASGDSKKPSEKPDEAAAFHVYLKKMDDLGNFSTSNAVPAFSSGISPAAGTR